MAGAGWICRNSRGSTIMAMAAPIGITTTLVAETWALLLAVRMATTRGWNHLCFETNSSALESLIKNGDNKAPWIIRHMIKDINQHLQQIPEYTPTNIYREGYQAADGLAHYTIDEQLQIGGGTNTFI
ncbi:uncharacterized protein LOC113312672 [Papaver somniferum]|uniref:uncharacterized protein LOC113312672 n=1 Tax=Papaver somniferum TaxID=3469 RepID=UPI000E704FDF|nr:uncharacterized protein LOC113312672 [Papaver somniferum]